jgi:hypothetical protein
MLDNNLSRPFIQLTGRRQHQSGIVLYDGPFRVRDVDFVNYPETKIYSSILSDNPEITPVPFGLAGGTESFINVTSGLSFNPEPVYRALIPPKCFGCLIRDLDGSLANTSQNKNGGSFLTGNESLGITADSNCVSGEEKYLNFSICPEAYTESSFNIFDSHRYLKLNGHLGYLGMWSQAFVAKRSDGVFSNELEDWPRVFGYNTLLANGNGTKFGLASSSDYDYELLLNSRRPGLWVNAEEQSIDMPVVKLIAHGKNCRLEITHWGDSNLPHIQPYIANSLDDLRSSGQSGYFTDGDDFYVKLIPHLEVPGIDSNSDHPAYTSEHYSAICQLPDDTGSYANSTDDDGLHPATENFPVDKTIVGKVDKFQKIYSGNTLTQIKVGGYACHFNRNKKINIEFTLGVQPLQMTSRDLGMANQSIISASELSDEAVAFACGVPGSHTTENLVNHSPIINNGYRFEFTLDQQQILNNLGKKVYVKGLSDLPAFTSNKHLENSGFYKIPTSISIIQVQDK